MNTNTSHYKSLPDLVVGGYGQGLHQYIGRIVHHGNAILGTVHKHALYIPSDGHEKAIKDNFHILTYQDRCQHHYQKCSLELSNMKCGCQECYEVPIV